MSTGGFEKESLTMYLWSSVTTNVFSKFLISKFAKNFTTFCVVCLVSVTFKIVEFGEDNTKIIKF